MVPDGNLGRPAALYRALDLPRADFLSGDQRRERYGYPVRVWEAAVDDGHAGAVHLDLDVRRRHVPVNHHRDGALVQGRLYPRRGEEVRILAEIKALAVDNVGVHRWPSGCAAMMNGGAKTARQRRATANRVMGISRYPGCYGGRRGGVNGCGFGCGFGRLSPAPASARRGDVPKTRRLKTQRNRCGGSNGIRTRVSALRGPRPRPS
jgi:hypothetical protein